MAENMSAQGQLFAPRVELHPFVVEQRGILDDASAADVDRIVAGLRMVGFMSGPGGDPHMEGYRGASIGAALAEVFAAHGIVLTSEGTG